MNMIDALKLAFVILITVVIIRILRKILNLFGIDFVGFFEDVWKKIKKIK